MRCPNCGFKGDEMNFDIIEYGRKLSFLRCPICGAKILAVKQ